MTGLVSVRAPAAGIRLQLLPRLPGLLQTGPQKTALSKLCWGGRKGFPHVEWGEEEGREEKCHVLVMGNIES